MPQRIVLVTVNSSKVFGFNIKTQDTWTRVPSFPGKRWAFGVLLLLLLLLLLRRM